MVAMGVRMVAVARTVVQGERKAALAAGGVREERGEVEPLVMVVGDTEETMVVEVATPYQQM